MTVAALFVTPDSHYKQLPDVDCFDIHRDARTFSGSVPVVAHPPCRSWGRLAHLAKPRHDERDLAFFAVHQVRRCGGVLEHPSASRLWSEADLPAPGTTQRDCYGGWTLPVSQRWWGHPCEKRTWLYIVGIEPAQLPAFPITFDLPQWTMGGKEGPKALRMVTPPLFASWLVDLARAVQ